MTAAGVDLEHFDRIDPTAIRGRRCGICHGEGYRRMMVGPRHSDWWACPCPTCQAAGLVPIPARECDIVAA